MERRYGRGLLGARRANFQWIYLGHLLTSLRRGRFDQRATRLSARCRAVKWAVDLSLAMTARGKTAWSRAIVRKCLFRLKISHCQRLVVHSRGNSQGKRKLVSAKARPCKTNAASQNSGRQSPGPDSRLTQTKSSFSRDNGRGTVDSRMQILRALVPGSRGLDTPIFLKETADYIEALNMQVQAMQALADCYLNSNAHGARHVPK